MFLCTASQLFAQTLTHRYSFNGDANDSVGTANGTLQGSATVDSSMLQLDGGGFVSLPANLINGYNQLSVEFWVTYAPNNRSEERRVGKECRSRWSPYH